MRFLVGQVVNLRPIGNRPGGRVRPFRKGRHQFNRRISNPLQVDNLPHYFLSSNSSTTAIVS